MLTLSSSERKAIDFVGYRYPHGDDLYMILSDYIYSSGSEWESKSDIDFPLSGEDKDKIRYLVSQSLCGGHTSLALFSEELSNKIKGI